MQSDMDTRTAIHVIDVAASKRKRDDDDDVVIDGLTSASLGMMQCREGRRRARDGGVSFFIFVFHLSAKLEAAGVDYMYSK